MAIEFTGEFTLPRPKEEVYGFLADPQKFAPCLPTYESVEMIDDTHAIVKVVVGLSKIRGTATIKLGLETQDPPNHAGYVGKGDVLQAAFNMNSSFDLEDTDDGGTLVKWKGEVKLFGKLISLAGGLLKPLAKKDINKMIGALQAALA